MKPACQPGALLSRHMVPLLHDDNSILQDLKNHCFPSSSQPWLNSASPATLSPGNGRPRSFLLPLMRVLPVPISVATSLDVVTNDIRIWAALRASSRAPMVWDRVKFSCIFNPHRLSCNWINEIGTGQPRERRKNGANSSRMNRTRSPNILQVPLLESWVWCWWRKLVEEVLQLLFLPTVSRDYERTVNTMLVCTAVGNTLKPSGVNIYGTVTVRQRSVSEKYL